LGPTRVEGQGPRIACLLAQVRRSISLPRVSVLRPCDGLGAHHVAVFFAPGYAPAALLDERTKRDTEGATTAPTERRVNSCAGERQVEDRTGGHQSRDLAMNHADHIRRLPAIFLKSRRWCPRGQRSARPARAPRLVAATRRCGALEPPRARAGATTSHASTDRKGSALRPSSRPRASDSAQPDVRKDIR